MTAWPRALPPAPRASRGGTASPAAEAGGAEELVQSVHELLRSVGDLGDDLESIGSELRASRDPGLVDLAARVLMAAERTRATLDRVRGVVASVAEEARSDRQRQQVGFSIIRAQEEERRRLARDIHDGPAQLLANVVFRIEVSQQLLNIDRDRAFAEMEQLKTLVRQSLQDVRKIIFDLRPMALDDLGLLPALRGYVSAFGERSGLACDLTVAGHERRLPPAAEVALFRIAQEALNNAWKHADASHVNVVFRFGRDTVSMTVHDDGEGFDPQEAQAREGGFGLVSMRERAGLVGGDLRVDSAPGRGTRVCVELPAPAGQGGQDE